MTKDLVAFSQIAGYNDPLKALRALLSYPMINWVSQYFSRTRNAESELYFVEVCCAVIEQHTALIPSGEREKYDRILICHKLHAYDALNRWYEYICLFERTLKEKRYTSVFAAFRDDPVFNSYVLWRDEKNKYVHFLYGLDRRYKVICRKQQRFAAGKSIEHLKRHQQSRLTDDELSERYGEMEKLFEFIKRRHTT